ncbi:hypothetical protein [Flavobacterium sp.]|mgnify:CR=1 FL=1|jgi:hypothetical protein|uniref:hypothetical protein n=1 Tax=Flavobacterium sp. TaxID=239 RepID=UPI00259AC55B|nr:hypothetical protein [uncultured Flavobacterium sp.]
MANLFRITAKRNDKSTKVNLTKGMYVEIATNTGKPQSKDLEKICSLFESKYGTMCTKGFVSLSDFEIEKIN